MDEEEEGQISTKEKLIKNPNCVLVQLQSNGRSVSSLRSALREARKRVQEKGFPISDKRADGLSD